MLVRPVMNLSAMSGSMVSACDVGGLFGAKVANLYRIKGIQPFAPTPFRVPTAICIAASSRMKSSDADIMEAHRRMLDVSKGRQPWLLRSSHITCESSGEWDSPPILLKYRRENTSARFLEQVRRMQEANPDLAIACMPMIGGWRMVEDWETEREIILTSESRIPKIPLYGGDCLSCVGDTVSDKKRSEMWVQMALGLGHTIVDGRGSAVFFVDRESGGINSVVNSRDGYSSRYGHSNVPIDEAAYRQKDVATFDPRTERINFRSLSDFVFQYESFDILRKHKRIVPFYEKDLFGSDTLGILPFEDAEAFTNVVGTLQFIHAELGPSEVELVLESRGSKIPYVVQHMETPEGERVTRDLSIPKDRRDLTSENVLGAGNLELPLVVIPWKDLYVFREAPEQLKSIDQLFGEESYILLVQEVSRPVVKASPHAKARLSLHHMNQSAHAYQLSREQMMKGGVGVIFAHSMQGISPSLAKYIAGESGDREPITQSNEHPVQPIGGIRVFPKVLLDSNGDDLALEFRGEKAGEI